MGDRLRLESRKRKFLVAALPADSAFPEFQDFDVIHDYLSTPGHEEQVGILSTPRDIDYEIDG